jgi:hypothetical protein
MALSVATVFKITDMAKGYCIIKINSGGLNQQVGIVTTVKLK